jgi:hypothetical protein
VTDVLATAASIGLAASADAVGTIDEATVLDALEQIASEHPWAADRCDAAARRVRSARSAGAQAVDPDSVFVSRGTVLQLRYRNEMVEVFMDLAIDLALDDERVDA